MGQVERNARVGRNWRNVVKWGNVNPSMHEGEGAIDYKLGKGRKEGELKNKERRSVTQNRE